MAKGLFMYHEILFFSSTDSSSSMNQYDIDDKGTVVTNQCKSLVVGSPSV